ncbi:MAG TPA: ATP-binding protein [Mycobacteriales bacterium]|nr:ATP-binding protein [Mycobacteriales bacterium]
MRPLDGMRSLKVKLGLVIVAAVVVTLVVNEVGVALDVWPPLRAAVAAALALGMVQILARGMTSPLREMARAAAAMSRGDYSRRVTTTSRDEVGELARAFTTMAADLAELDRERRDLVANVSHELRTPISALQAVLENMVDGVQAADPELLATMFAQVERLGRLVSQLLDLSRLESGAAQLERGPVSLRTVLDAAARETRLHRSDATIEVRVDPPTLRVDGDGERLHQVVVNLLDNALRHAPAGSAVRVTAAADGAAGCVLSVVDEGPGIDPADAGRIFERFYRCDPSRSESGGAGLGLAIARWVIDLHGGDIGVDLSHFPGCRMVVTLPGATS